MDIGVCPARLFGEVAGGKIGGLSVKRAALINDFELGQNPALRDTFEFDRFIWEPD